MAIMSYYLKLHAPGAKTFFQVHLTHFLKLKCVPKVIKSRYGSTTHSIVLVFGLFTNIIVTLSLLLGGTAVLTGLVQGLSPEFASMLLVVLIGGYTLVGGLGVSPSCPLPPAGNFLCVLLQLLCHLWTHCCFHG